MLSNHTQVVVEQPCIASQQESGSIWMYPSAQLTEDFTRKFLGTKRLSL